MEVLSLSFLRKPSFTATCVEMFEQDPDTYCMLYRGGKPLFLTEFDACSALGAHADLRWRSIEFVEALEEG
eukprot:2572845-Amphidinium_carterae.1